MKILSIAVAVGLMSGSLYAQTGKIAGATGSTSKPVKAKQLYMDIHQLEPGKVKFADVAAAHQKDLAVEKKYGVNLLSYWVDEKAGVVMCLAEATDPNDLVKTHKEAHGLLPEKVYPVTDGVKAPKKGNTAYWMDIHHLGAGNVTAAAVAEAHKKDLAVEKKYGVNLINYWVDEKAGVVMCLAQAKDSSDLIKTHKEAHGLLPDKVIKVKQGQ